MTPLPYDPNMGPPGGTGAVPGVAGDLVMVVQNPGGASPGDGLWYHNGGHWRLFNN
jgi:hypothetical protein